MLKFILPQVAEPIMSAWSVNVMKIVDYFLDTAGRDAANNI